MPRWIFTSLLGLGGVAAVVLTPLLTRTAVQPVAATPPLPLATSSSGPLTVTAHLDYEALPTGVDGGATTSRNLVITVSAAAPDQAPTRVPVDLAVVVDTSGSMSDQGKFNEARRALHVLADELLATDQLSLVTFSSFVNTPVTLGPANQTASLAATLLDQMSPGGSTYLSGGLAAGFSALGNADPGDTGGRVRRVLLMTDGQANQGVIDQAGLTRLARRDGISVSTIGVGLDYDEGILSAMADAGGGEYHYVGHDTDLASVYRAELKTAGSVVATGTTLDLTFPAGVHGQRACSWAFEALDSSHLRVPLGDLSAGQTRTIVVPITVDGAVTDGVIVNATAQATSTQRHAMVASASLTVPRVSASDVENYEQPEADAAATRALAGEAVEDAREAWNRGDSAYAKEKLAWGSGYVRAKREEGKVGKKDAELMEADLKQLESLGYVSDAQEGAKSASTISRKMSR